jgi:hypothetical protein
MMNWQNNLKKQARGLTECDVAEDTERGVIYKIKIGL